MRSSLVVLVSLFSAVLAANFTVMVGANNSFEYTPNTITNAAVGDTISFVFMAKNHSVTQSTFANPCTSSGIDSGFQTVIANSTNVPSWSFTINNVSAPLWFFCAQPGHCQKGMVLAVNPTAQKSFDAFKAAAIATPANGTASAGASPAGTAGGAGSSASPIASPAGGAAANGAVRSFGLSTSLVGVVVAVAAGLL